MQKTAALARFGVAAAACPTGVPRPRWQASTDAFAPSMRQRIDFPGHYAKALYVMPKTCTVTPDESTE